MKLITAKITVVYSTVIFYKFQNKYNCAISTYMVSIGCIYSIYSKMMLGTRGEVEKSKKIGVDKE